MVSIRSNLNSVSSVTDGLTAVKKRLSTCFQNWCHLNTISTNTTTKIAQQHQQQQTLFYSEKRFNSKTKKNLKLFNTRLKNFFSPKKSPSFPRVRVKREKGAEQKVEVVAKLVSTLLLTSTTTSTTTQTSEQAALRGFEQDLIDDDIMTITNNDFLQIRDEYPDLEAEVRSILIGRAQNGATISEIKDDYKKMTGLHFPIYNNITDFLLSIPSVSALCNEQGTRIFSIVPTEKTKHLYDMVLMQKPQIVRPNSTQYGQNQLRANRYNINNNNANNHKYTSNVSYYYNNNNRKNNQNTNEPASLNPARHQQQLEKNCSRSDLLESGVESNCFYEDNCYYINNRFAGPQNLPALYVNNCNSQANNNNINGIDYIVPTTNNNNIQCIQDLNNNNNDIIDLNVPKQNNLMPLNNICSLAKQIAQQQEQHEEQPQQQQQQPNELQQQYIAISSSARRTVNPFRATTRPTQLMPPPSSPTATRSSEFNESQFTVDSDYEAHLLDFPLLGDDFFLYLARMELKCKFKKYEKIFQAGLCVSGQTIGAAIRRVRILSQGASLNRRVIVNIGSVDIMRGRPLVQIEHDFRELINVMHKNGLIPILTTLAPLANYSHIGHLKERLERFNEFIKRTGKYLIVIDIWSILVNSKGQTLFDCYQKTARNVTGTPEPHVFWNNIGRQRVLQLIESQIEY